MTSFMFLLAKLAFSFVPTKKLWRKVELQMIEVY